MNKRCFVFLVLLLFCLSACSNTQNVAKHDSVVTVEKNPYYEITLLNNEYYCLIYNKENEVVKKEGPLNQQPSLIIIPDGLVRLTVQSGTGLSTQWGYYYDTEKESFSEVFHWIFDQKNGKVACGCANGIVIKSIFSDEYFYEIADFKHPLSNVVEPFLDAEFSDDGTSIKVTYLSGEDYEEITEDFVLI